MQSPRIPGNEPARLRALAQYDILDTEDEPQFDAITRIAAAVLDVPIVLVSFIDADRQWFKARYGVNYPSAPRELTFCGHVVADEREMVVADSQLDPRFADHPAVEGTPFVRFYAGMPLSSKDGFVLGTLCAVDHRPRELSPRQLEAMQLLAQQVMALLELRRVARELRDERRVLAESERQLAENDRLLRSVFDGMVEGVVLHDGSGAIAQCNRAAETILGTTIEQLAGTGPSAWGGNSTDEHGMKLAPEAHPSAVALRTGKAVTNQIVVVEWRTGQSVWLSVNARPLIRPGEQVPYASVSTFRDITEERRIAGQLALHQRLVTTGTLAAGVGHEINNPLTYLLTNLALATEELQAASGALPADRIAEVLAMLDQAQEGGQRVKRIVRGLKSLARDDGAGFVPADLRSVIDTALELASHEIKVRATVVLELAELSRFLVDESRLTQVVINLVVNAAQAFSAAAPDTNRIVIRTAREATSVVLEVTDNGPGIAPDVLPRIFDPFFTTRPVGVGTGLGLSISHGIVAALGGELTCDTRIGHGTTFRVRLPLPAEEVPAVEPLAPVGRGRVLLIDDERSILQSTRRLFRGEFEVIALEDPREALRRITAGEQFDVVFSDMSMPNLSGMELYDQVARIAPALAARFVFISGDMSRDDIRRFLARIPNERLEKPFSIQNLRSIARRFVAAGGAEAADRAAPPR